MNKKDIPDEELDELIEVAKIEIRLEKLRAERKLNQQLNGHTLPPPRKQSWWRRIMLFKPRGIGKK